MLNPKTYCHSGLHFLFACTVHKKSRSNFFWKHMLKSRKDALLLTCICFPKVLTIFLANANTHWTYKDRQFNNCFFWVKIAGSFHFGAVVHGICIYICKALRDCFTFIIMLKASINSRQVSVNLVRLVLGGNVNAAMP